MFTIGGASAGFQIGGSSTDFVLLIMTPAAVDKVLAGKTKVGSDMTAATGPSGATSSGSVGGADILTYGRAKGLFAGIMRAANFVVPSSSPRELITDCVWSGCMTWARAATRSMTKPLGNVVRSAAGCIESSSSL
jgi:lipid-binding SYLF domain-containing protein